MVSIVGELSAFGKQNETGGGSIKMKAGTRLLMPALNKMDDLTAPME